MKPQHRWDARAWTEFRDLPRDTMAVLPVAAIEQHGPHLPLSVDADLNAGILDRALARLDAALPVLVLPAQVVGHSPEHARFPGTLSLSAETILALWTEIGAGVARAGIGKLLIFNSHGGQPQLVDLVCQRLRSAHRLFTVGVSWFDLPQPEPRGLPATEMRWGIHGGAIETAMMRHLHPQTVREARAADFASTWIAETAHARLLAPHGPVRFGWETQDLNPAGAVGDARLGDAALGEALVDSAAAALAALIVEIHRFDAATYLRDAPMPG
jgi:creatinine amidohydrolase